MLEEGDVIKIDIPNRSINADISEAEFAARRQTMEAKGKVAWKPQEKRARKLSTALKAYATLTTSASMGAVRMVPEDA